MHDTLHESKQYKGLTIEIHYDYDCQMDHCLGDEPCAVATYEGWGKLNVFHDNLDNYPSNGHIIRAIAECRGAPDLTADFLAGELGYDLRTTGKRFAVDFGDGWRYFKTDAARVAAMLKNEGWENIKVETFTGPCQGDYYYFIYDQKILNEYAGGKGDATPATQSADDCVNGNVYGYIIKDADGEDLDSDEHDSCWGFVGEPDYCMKEAESVADSIAARRQEAADSAMAERIADERPDLAPAYEAAP